MKCEFIKSISPFYTCENEAVAMVILYFVNKKIFIREGISYYEKGFPIICQDCIYKIDIKNNSDTQLIYLDLI